MGDAISLRVQELKQLPKATGIALDFVKVTRQAIGSWPTTKPWLNATDTEELLKQVGLAPSICLSFMFIALERSSAFHLK